MHVFSCQNRVEADHSTLQAKLEEVQTTIQNRARSSRSGTKQPALIPPRSARVHIKAYTNDRSQIKLNLNNQEKNKDKGCLSQA